MRPNERTPVSQGPIAPEGESSSPTVLERLQIAGLDAQLVAEFKDIRRRRKPCGCRLCEARRHEKRGAA
jgi:hypothetical protein